MNDTIIGDPQFTVSLPDGSASMCYEIHGGEEKYFNLISDTCTSVNARFSAMQAMPDVNRMRVIGMYAATSATPNGNCAEIEININNCSASLDGELIELMAEVDDIRIRKFNNRRWRVSVPNCERRSAVMWITCENNMLRFRIVRGSNLAPTSHGLLGKYYIPYLLYVQCYCYSFHISVGQFWNIPMNIIHESGKPYVQIYSPDNPKHRKVAAFEYTLTWDHTPMTCYYVGNKQGGGGAHSVTSESVIEGFYHEYEMSSLYDTSFGYSMFADSVCSTVPI